MTEYQTFEHDVLVIGAAVRGSGRPSRRPRRVPKSVRLQVMLGKAHRSWPREGGGALANVDDRDN